jgi:hypothetical protein
LFIGRVEGLFIGRVEGLFIERVEKSFVGRVFEIKLTFPLTNILKFIPGHV